MSVITPPGYIQASSYTAADLRRNNTSAVFQRSLNDTTNQGAQGGFMPGRAANWSISGFNLTVGEFTGIVENTFGTNQGEYTVINTANQLLTFANSSTTQNRIDIVGIQIQDAFYSGSTNSGTLVIFQGANSSGTPTPPTLPSSVLPILSASIPANSTTPTITGTRRSVPAAGGIATLLDSQSSDSGAFVGAYRSYLTGGAGGLPNNLLSSWGSDSAWHGVQPIRLARPTPSFANSSGANVNSNTTQVIASVSVPDPGYPYFIVAGAGFLVHNQTGGDITNANFSHRLACVVDTSTLPSSAGPTLVSVEWEGVGTSQFARPNAPMRPSTGSFTGTHTVNLLFVAGSQAGVLIGPLNTDLTYWFDVMLIPA